MNNVHVLKGGSVYHLEHWKMELHPYAGPTLLKGKKEAIVHPADTPSLFYDSFERWRVGGKGVEYVEDKRVCIVPVWCKGCKGSGKATAKRGSMIFDVGRCGKCRGRRVVFGSRG